MSEPLVTHGTICDLLGIQRSRRAYNWTRYASQKTKVEVYVEGERVRVFGGALVCACCGYEISIRPEGHGPDAGECPRCHYDGVDYEVLPAPDREGSDE